MKLKVKKNNVTLIYIATILVVATTGIIITTTIIPFLQVQMVEAQQITGDITAPADGNAFGGQKMGTITVNSDGHWTNVTADLNASPNEGNIFEGWLVDAGGSGYKLSLGQFANGTLNFTQYMPNPYTYKNFEVTEEPSEDPDPNAAESIAGFELDDPFGR
jgi:hypothetical protein